METPDVVGYCRDLLRIDTSNPGSTEEPAAAYVVERLEAVGIATETVEPEPGRCSVVARLSGSDATLPALLVHSHLDVVPAQSDGWSHDPFGGIEADGCLWGRGALDMKAFAAMMLAVQIEFTREGRAPRRDVVFAYFADEEMGGTLGSRWVAENRPDLLAGVTEAIGEIGGFSVWLDGRAVYPIQTAEKGALWARVEVPGTSGHAAYPVMQNPIGRLATLIARILELRTDDPPPDPSTQLRKRLALAVGIPATESDRILDRLGSFGAVVRCAERTSFEPTVVSAGSKTNVVPDRAELIIDCRCVPGGYDRALEAIRSAIDPDMRLEILLSSDGLVSPIDAPLVEACRRAVIAHDPDAVVVPFVMPAGTDAQRVAPLGIAGYGFSPLTLPPGFDYLPLFHAPDERVPVDAIVGGRTILHELLSTC